MYRVNTKKSIKERVIKMTIKITISNKLEQFRKRLGIKTECEEAFEMYEEALKTRRSIFKLYKKGLKKKDEKLQNEALSQMRAFCSQKTIKCSRGQCTCEDCYFGFSGPLYEPNSNSNKASIEST